MASSVIEFSVKIEYIPRVIVIIEEIVEHKISTAIKFVA